MSIESSELNGTSDAINAAEMLRRMVDVLRTQTATAAARKGLTLDALRPEALSMEVNRTLEPLPTTALEPIPIEPPWTLQQFFNGEIDLDVELGKRFPAMPMMSLFQFRTLGATSGRKVCTLSTQDGSASLILDADTGTKVIQLSFTLGSMLTLRFTLDHLSAMDRTRWLELMRREQGGLAFLWGENRWEHDYLICVSRKHHTNFFAFSPNHFEAGVRLTPASNKQLLDWLEELWKADAPSAADSTPLLTW